MATVNFQVQLNDRQVLAAARETAKTVTPYFASALYSLIFVPTEGMLETRGAAMAVSEKLVCFYDPRVVAEVWSIDDVVFGLLHEVGHILRDHAKRRDANGYDHYIWNAACDAAINDDLVAMGLKPLDTDMLPHKIKDEQGKPLRDGLIEEVYYEALRNDPDQQKSPDDGEDDDGDGAQGQQPQGKPGRPGSQGTPCGGCSGNKVSEELEGSNDVKGRSQVEVERVKKQVARDIQEHIEQHGAGSVPSALAVWADNELQPPKVAWQDKLRRHTLHGTERARGLVDFSYGRPSRRQSAVGFGSGSPVLPSMYAPKPRIAVVIDTSASMGNQDLIEAMSEVDGVLKQVEGNVLIGVCDAEMKGGLRNVRTTAEACAMLEGGGGTDFRPIFEALDEMPRSERPHVVIVATDGDGPAPPQGPPGMTVIWLLVGEHAVSPYTSRHDRIDWGEKIWLKDAA